jgi:hypothetical protein
MHADPHFDNVLDEFSDQRDHAQLQEGGGASEPVRTDRWEVGKRTGALLRSLMFSVSWQVARLRGHRHRLWFQIAAEPPSPPMANTASRKDITSTMPGPTKPGIND